MLLRLCLTPSALAILVHMPNSSSSSSALLEGSRSSAMMRPAGGAAAGAGSYARNEVQQREQDAGALGAAQAKHRALVHASM
jgi:hypothetical protein